MIEIDLGKVMLSDTEKEKLMPKTGGIFTGTVTAMDSNDMIAQVRNITFSVIEPTSVPDGQIIMVYE